MPSAQEYEPLWMPPHSSPGTCTSQQISDAYALCDGGSPRYSQLACRSFKLDEANSACLGCLFSAIGGDSSGAIIVFPGDRWLANIGGCIALVDGDTSSKSCGAKAQAANVCRFDICLAVCDSSSTSEDWDACREAARAECSQYIDAAACQELPRNARCLYSSFQEFFLGIGDVFCGSGPDGSGAGGAGGAEAGGAGSTGGEGGAGGRQ